MAGIKIGDLPPASLPLAGTEQVELQDDAGDSVRAAVDDVAASASGLDATFITVTANAVLPNERVLTEGTNISFVDTGPNGTLTINAAGLSFPLLAPDGSAAAPQYAFASDNQSGLFLNAGGELSLAADGIEIARAINGLNNQFAIALSGGSSVPDLTSLGDLDTGFRWPANNQTVWIGGGSRAWNFSTAKFFSQFSNGPALMNEVSSRTNPTVVPDHADENTGIGSGGGDELSIIAGGVEAIRVEEIASFITVTYFGTLIVPTGTAGAASVGFDSDPDTGYFSPVADAVAITTGGFEAVRWAELSSQVIQTNNNQVGLTASVTQTQAGGLVLLNSYNEVATVGTTGDALTAFAVVAGTRLTVINNGANNLQLFPAVGDDFGAGVDAAITIVAGDVGIFIGRDATNWDTLYNGTPTPSAGLSFPLLAPDGTAGAPSYSFSGETDLGMFRLAEDFLGFSVNGINRIVIDTSGITGPIGNSGKIVNVGATNTIPSIVAANGDTNTGLGWGGIDILTLVAGGVEIARAVQIVGSNQFIVAPGAIQNNLSAPDLGLGDGDTGIMQTVDDTLALVAGANQAVRYAEASAQIVQTNNNLTGLTASVTQTQAGGLALISSYNEVAIVATEGDALTAFAVEEGTRLIVINNGANGLQLFPAVGDNFGAGVDASVTIAANSTGVFLGRDSTNWDTLQNQSATGSVFQGLGTWRYRTEITSPPSTGQVRFNNADPTLATEMFLHETNDLGTDVNNFLNLLSAGSLFYIQDRSDAGNFFIVEISTNVDNGTDRTFGIANITLTGVEPNQNTRVLIVAVESGGTPPAANDVAQARRTTDLVLTTAFVDVTLDTTDVETDAAVLNHDLVTNTDNIIIGATGTYKIGYEVDIEGSTFTESTITVDGRVRLNDAGTGIAGSNALCGVFSDGSIIAEFMQNHLSQTFYANLTSGDFITLQLEKVEIGGVAVFTATRILLTAERCL